MNIKVVVVSVNRQDPVRIQSDTKLAVNPFVVITNAQRAGWQGESVVSGSNQVTLRRTRPGHQANLIIASGTEEEIGLLSLMGH